MSIHIFPYYVKMFIRSKYVSEFLRPYSMILKQTVGVLRIWIFLEKNVSREKT